MSSIVETGLSFRKLGSHLKCAPNVEENFCCARASVKFETGLHLILHIVISFFYCYTTALYMYKLTKWTKLILSSLCFICFIGLINRHPNELPKNYVEVKFLDYANVVFLNEFFGSLEDELSYSNSK